MKPFKIQDFINQFDHEYSRANMFYVEFLNLKDGDFLTYVCKDVEVPGLTFLEGQYQFLGKNRKIVIGRDFDPIGLVFRIDGSGKTLKIFDGWTNEIINENNQYGFLNDYAKQANIYLLNRNGDIFDTIKIDKFYPINISPVSFSWDSSDTISEIQIAFNYESFVHEFVGLEKATDIKNKMEEKVTGLDTIFDAVDKIGDSFQQINNINNKIQPFVPPGMNVDIRKEIPDYNNYNKTYNDSARQVDYVETMRNAGRKIF